MPRFRPSAFAALGICLALACRGPGAPPRPLRLVDRDATGDVHVAIIDGRQLRVLDPERAEHVFQLADAPPRSQLVFAVGVPLPGESVVRFEVEMRSPSAAVETVYRRDVRGSAWKDEAVDLSGHELRNRQLVFRKTLVDGPATALAAAAWGNPVLLPAGGTPVPAVVLVSLDTLRADRVHAYGGKEAPPTPRLDALAGAGVLYETAYAPSTWTLPSHRALFFGRPPIALPPPPPDAGGGADRAVVLAGILQRAGYLTAGFTGGGFVSREFGFSTGFDEYYQFAAPAGTGPPACAAERLDGPEVFRRAVDWLARYGRFPSFLFVHTYDPHDRCPLIEVPVRPFRRLKFEDGDRLVRHYGAMVTEADGLVGSLVDALERGGLSRTTLLIVTSDHGEALWEHGIEGHGENMKPYEEIARIPLILRIPGRGTPGARIVEPVSLVDVAPTILHALGMEPSLPMWGRVLPGLGFADTPDRDDVPVYVDSGAVLGVRRGDRILIATRGGGFPDEVYDVVADPDQRRTLLRDPTLGVLKQLATDYWEQRRGAAPAKDGGRPRPEQLDPATRERLHALGYVE